MAGCIALAGCAGDAASTATSSDAGRDEASQPSRRVDESATAPADAATASPKPSEPKPSKSSTPQAPASSASASVSAAGPPSAECRNLAVSAQVKSTVTRTWETAKRISHMQPEPGSFYYGGCGTAQYAAARFQATPGATGTDLVALQDEGSVLQFFRYQPGTGWKFVTSDSFPPTNNCAIVAPPALAELWHCR
ncbi:hypothetical protein [Streptomyces smaragdinus]|uniref:hypothetical protein n=1 Tax=Streptomyces smaragdinus TaxID=2585196 RepID=UPI00188693D7|nr:hypothetical protein [Streptomyces smaragdinus]